MATRKETKIWDGVFATFSEAGAKENVFEGEIWLNKVAQRAQSLLAASKEQSCLSSLTTTSDRVLPVVAALTSRPERVIRILDWGGGPGFSYLPLVTMLPKEQPLEFVVVENKSICQMGRELFKDDQQIAFLDSFPANQVFDIVHASSSVHYVDDWRALIAQFAGTHPNYLIFVDLPAGDIETFVTTQVFHGRRIPVRFWNFEEFTSEVSAHGYELAFKARHRGYYLESNADLPMSNFDAKHRLNTVCQLIFRRKA